MHGCCTGSCQQGLVGQMLDRAIEGAGNTRAVFCCLSKQWWGRLEFEASAWENWWGSASPHVWYRCNNLWEIKKRCWFLTQHHCVSSMHKAEKNLMIPLAPRSWRPRELFSGKQWVDSAYNRICVYLCCWAGHSEVHAEGQERASGQIKVTSRPLRPPWCWRSGTTIYGWTLWLRLCDSARGNVFTDHSRAQPCFSCLCRFRRTDRELCLWIFHFDFS